MAICVGCGLDINSITGLLEVQKRPGGGIHCDNTGDPADDGLYVDINELGLATDAELLVVSDAANAAATAAAAAQATANAALPYAFIDGDLVLNGVANGAGDIAVAHGLGAVPRTAQLTPFIPGGGSIPWTVAVEALDAGNINVRVFNCCGATAPGLVVSFYWLALR